MNENETKTKNEPPADHVPLKAWIGIYGAMLGAFMAVLDIQITNSSLKDIQGALGASLDEGSWISTAYLVAEIIVIPLTGWLSQVFSIKRYIMVNALLFTIFSMLCGQAYDLTSMIIFRACQGFTGGVLIPMAFTVMLTKLPQSKRPIGMALFTITATFAPAIGPSLGGYITDNFGWQYIFYLNILPGILMLACIYFAFEAEPMRLDLLKKGDYLGILFMAIGMSSLEIVLEEGNRKDWFGNEVILNLAITALISLTLFFITEFTVKNPFINLRLLSNRNFGLAGIVNVVMGLGLYGSVFILPLYLGQIQGYSSLQIGEVMMWAGIPQLFMIPIIVILMKKMDMRLMIGIGVFTLATSFFMNTTMNHDTGRDQLVLSLALRSFGQPFIFVPLSSLSIATIPASQAGSASGLYNMMRNLGGSIGIAMLSTLLTWREQLHSLRIGEHVSIYEPATRQALLAYTAMTSHKNVHAFEYGSQALQILGASIKREAFVMAFNDCFYVMGMAFVLSSFTVVFFNKVKATSTSSEMH